MSKKSQMTAYEYNTRKQSSVIDLQSNWSIPIQELLKKQHSFLPMTYQAGGYLFRGMSHGFFSAIEQGSFGLFDDDNPHSALEQELKVIFVSHELSDALACARCWESRKDFVVLILSADLFIQEHKKRTAAMMSFAEPGVVFKYPFFVRDILVDEVNAFVISDTIQSLFKKQMPEKFLLLKDKLITVPVKNTNRSDYEQILKEQLEQKAIEGATTVNCSLFPK